jgi:hypothetical protein
MRDTTCADLDLDQLVMLLADGGPNDQQLVALAEVVRRASDADGLAEALKRVEWVFSPYEQENFCPSCHNAQKDGHEHPCDLADTLTRYRGKR